MTQTLSRDVRAALAANLTLPTPAFDQERTYRHNDAVAAWLDDSRSAPGPDRARDLERGILDAIAGVCSWVQAHPTDPDNYDEGAERPAVDPFAVEYIVGPMVDGIRNALNCETGRLIGGDLSRVVESIAARVGMPA